jgi:uncharacterized protein YkwD
LRKVAAALLAVPVVAVLYMPVLLRRSIAARVAIAVGAGSLIAIGALGLVTPTRTVANAPLAPIVPLSNAAFSTSITAGTELDEAVSITFSAPMDATSVAAALDVDPPVPVSLAWDETGTRLTIGPTDGWKPATYHTITVPAGALGQSGRPMAVPARAVFLTRTATTARIEATALDGEEATIATGIRFTFDHIVAIGDVRRGLQIEPPVLGSLDAAAAPAGTSAFVFTPSSPLSAGTAYTVRLVGLVDAAGAALASDPTLAITTTDAPRVVRFRPADNTKNLDRGAILSVRFSESMDRRSTRYAFAATINGTPVAGKISFAEKDTVLVFRPAEALPYGVAVDVLVKASARSAAGVPLEAAKSIRLGVEAKPAPPRPAPVRQTTSTPISSGGAVGSGSWGAVETYYMKLMNCTRTGGWVTSTGSCSSPGGRAVAPLMLDAGISSKVSRPYAKKLAVNNLCTHFSGGNPGDRLRAAGYTSYIWAENLGCRSGDPYAAVLGSHLYFQSEKSYNGGHYVNMMNAKYDRAGVGVWVASGRVRLVVDFYHPR